MEGGINSNRDNFANILLPEVSIIIPAKNEPYLPSLISSIKKVLKNTEILIQTEEGLGNAVRKGFKKARGEKIVIMDADGQHNPKYLPEIVKSLDEYEMVICSRLKDERSFFRRIISKIATCYVKKKFKLKIKDPLSGYFGVRKSLIKNLKLQTNGFKIGLEIILKAKPRIKEIPIVLEERKLGKSKAGLKELIELWKIN
jgi:dolichol-phosphate mannosyltransferase